MLKPAATLSLLAFALGACAEQAREQGSYSDPFAYCAAVGTADKPGAAYTGKPLPDDVAAALRQAIGASPDLPAATMTWRCMDGQVYGCTVGANLPCDQKADTSRQPSQAVRAFCTAQRDADAVPASVTGRATIYAWRCEYGRPKIAQRIATPDAQGYLADIWYPLSPPN
ncbi:MAG: hypothetical protein AAF495_04775 [Pseudomonadota bacterium]